MFRSAPGATATTIRSSGAMARWTARSPAAKARASTGPQTSTRQTAHNGSRSVGHGDGHVMVARARRPTPTRSAP